MGLFAKACFSLLSEAPSRQANLLVRVITKDLLGGKNWRNLLGYALKFMDTPEIGSMIMDAIPNPKTRRMVENAITRGLWDQMDELQPVVEELEEDMEDYNASCHGKGPRSIKFPTFFSCSQEKVE